jgi:hypothetical protein
MIPYPFGFFQFPHIPSYVAKKPSLNHDMLAMT